MLAPRVLAQRASNVEGSLELLMLAPSALLAKRLLAPARTRRFLRRAADVPWRLEGAAQFFSGQTRHVRPAVVLRTHDGPPPASRPPAATRCCWAAPSSTCSPARRVRRRASSSLAPPTRHARSSAPSTAARCARPSRPGARTSTGSRGRASGRRRASRPERGIAAGRRFRRRGTVQIAPPARRAGGRRRATRAGRRPSASPPTASRARGQVEDVEAPGLALRPDQLLVADPLPVRRQRRALDVVADHARRPRAHPARDEIRLARRSPAWRRSGRCRART